MCVHFSKFDHLRIKLQSSDLFWGIKFCAPSLLPPLIFSYLQALIHGFLWWCGCSWLIFSLTWHLQSHFLLLHSAAIDLQEAKDSIDEEDPRPTSSTWSYIKSATQACFLQFQDTSELPNRWHIPFVLFLSSLRPAKSKFEKPGRFKEVPWGYHKPTLGVPLRYSMILLTAVKWDSLGSS